MSKNWFLLASVSCGIGFGSTFLISRNLQQSALAGLGTVPAVAASMTILSRQRREDDRQVAESRLSLDDARQQEQLLKDNCRKISAHGQRLQTGCTRLRQEVDRLDAEVLARQNNLQTTQAQLAQIQAQRQLSIDYVGQSNLQLQSIRDAIHQYTATKQQLEAQITDLKNQDQSLKTILVDKKVDLRGIEYQISQKEDRRNQISSQISGLDLQKQSLQQGISALSLQKQDLEVLFNELVVDISTKQTNLFELDAKIIKKQADLVQAATREQSAIDSAQIAELALSNIEAQIHKNSAIEKHLNVKITDLQNQAKSLQAEIASSKVAQTQVQQQISVLKKQAWQISTSVNDLNRSVEKQESLLDDLDLELCNRRQVEKDINSQINKLEQKISQLEKEEILLKTAGNDLISPVYKNEIPEKWGNHLIFENNPHLRVLKHIDVYGTITELEIGTAREQRQFNIRFDEYLEYLPFSISNREGRYLKIAKERIIITDVQNPADLAQLEQEIDKLNRQKEQLSIAIDELSRSVERDLERQVELRRNITDLLEEKQKLEDKVRIEQDRLNQITNEIEDIGLDSVGEADESPPNSDNSDSYRRCSCGGTPVRGELFCYRCS
jgi:chromosome segregation ATPase